MVFRKEVGFGATVRINNRDAPELDDPEGEPLDVCVEKLIGPKTLVSQKYIESTPGTHFSIRLQAKGCEGWPWSNQPKRACGFDVYVDGNWCEGRFVYRDDVKHGRSYSEDIDGKETPSGHLYKFKFSHLTTEEVATQEQVIEDMKTAGSLGLIQIVVSRGIVGDTPADPKSRNAPDSVTNLAEKALKGRSLSHAISYMDPVQIPTTEYLDFEEMDEHAIAIFNFKYRSRADLEHEMIVPRPPRSPTPDAIAGLSREEIDRLAREHLQRIARDRSVAAGVKEEGSSSMQVKRAREPEAWDLTEEIEPPRKISKPSPVIDLTED